MSKRNEKRLQVVLGFTCLVFILGLIPIQVFSQQVTGVSPLIQLSNSSMEELLTPTTRRLLTSSDLESFLQDLEEFPPEWKSLHDQPGEELGERLFQWNRLRDDARKGHQLLRQHVAFFWSGLLRQYDHEYQGFRVAIGPVLTKTSWGIVRFKPLNFPVEMIAIPSKLLKEELQSLHAQGKQIEISILFTGFLVPNESLMYTFSHENSQDGMILPFVQIDRVQYVLR